MGTAHYAKLIYGYDLGSDEGPLIEQTKQFGEITTPWFKRDEDGYVDEGLDEAIVRRLYEALPGDEPASYSGQAEAVQDHYGVVLESHGYGAEAVSQYALAAYVYEVDGGDSEVIDPNLLLAMQPELDDRLDRAMAVLTDFTPTRKRGWTLLADR